MGQNEGDLYPMLKLKLIDQRMAHKQENPLPWDTSGEQIYTSIALEITKEKNYTDEVNPSKCETMWEGVLQKRSVRYYGNTQDMGHYTCSFRSCEVNGVTKPA